MAPGGESLIGPMPWLADRPENFAVAARLSPNMHLFARVDNVHPFVIWPLSPTRCRLLIYNIFPQQHFADPAFAAKAQVYHDFWIPVVEEDRSMVQSLQRVTESPFFTPGRMSKLEGGVQHAIKDCLDRIFGGGA